METLPAHARRWLKAESLLAAGRTFRADGYHLLQSAVFRYARLGRQVILERRDDGLTRRTSEPARRT